MRFLSGDCAFKQTNRHAANQVTTSTHKTGDDPHTT